MHVHTWTSGVSLISSHFVFYCFMISYFGHVLSLPLSSPSLSHTLPFLPSAFMNKHIPYGCMGRGLFTRAWVTSQCLHHSSTGSH